MFMPRSVAAGTTEGWGTSRGPKIQVLGVKPPVRFEPLKTTGKAGPGKLQEDGARVAVGVPVREVTFVHWPPGRSAQVKFPGMPV